MLLILGAAPFVYADSSAPPNIDLATVCGAFQIEKQNGETIDLSLEIAASPERLTNGLMHREYLAPEGGMLFVLKPARKMAMWMKNTLIPLDILYIAPDRTIIKIHENAVPHDLTPLPSGGVIGYAIELRGGAAERLGLSVGDYLAGFDEILTF
ncbi:MAG: DUF192 domain-containing protein [Pseudomonadota bacterium]